MSVDVTIRLPEIEAELKAIRKILENVHRAVRLVFFNQQYQEISMLQITDIQKCTLSIQPVDARGNPASLPTAPSWSVSNPDILALTVAEDGLSAEVAAVGPDGDCQVSVSADTGTHVIAGQLDVKVVSSEAVSLNIVAGAPVAE